MNNRKGFTLVELLAVIVILAILMVSAGAGVMATMNNSKVNIFKDEALTMIDGANKMYSELSMSTSDSNTFIKSNTCEDASADTYAGYTKGTCETDLYSGMCISVAGLVNNGAIDKDIQNYAGIILVEVPYEGGATKYSIWVHNNTYGINGTEKTNINKLKFNKETNSDANVSKINGTRNGIVTKLDGIKKLIKLVYGAEGQTGDNPTNGNDTEVLFVSAETNSTYKLKCINKKLTTSTN